MAWVEKELKGHLVATPLLWAGLPTSRPGCPEPHPPLAFNNNNVRKTQLTLLVKA